MRLVGQASLLGRPLNRLGEAKSKEEETVTLSITARCHETGMMGVAIASSSICVASRCIWAKAGIGAIATQNITDPRLALKGLDHLEAGMDAPGALNRVVAESNNMAWRQLAIVDSKGRTAYFAGENMLGTHGSFSGEGCIAAGNLLASAEIPKIMVEDFFDRVEAQPLHAHLASRLISALEAGLAAGGEVGPVRSAGVLVVHHQPWPFVDLRVDWAEEDPVGGLRKLWLAYQPQMDDYVTRALDPAAAPHYGVPGDL
jgi:uncharacterized Ntn-hydrolase superfamily protein